MQPFAFRHAPLGDLDTWTHVDEAGVLDHGGWELELASDGSVHGMDGDLPAAYLGLAWRLAGHAGVVAVPGHHGARAAAHLGIHGTPVRWELRLEDAGGRIGAPHVVAASAAAGADPVAVEVDDWRMLCRLHAPLRRDASSHLMLARRDGPAGARELPDLLAQRRAPTVAQVVRAAGVLVHVVLGEDRGYANALFVAAPADRLLQLQAIVDDHHQAVSEYEAGVQQLGSPAEAACYDELVDLLGGIRPARER